MKRMKTSSFIELIKWGLVFGFCLGVLDILYQGNYQEAGWTAVFHLLTSLCVTVLISFLCFFFILAVPAIILQRKFNFNAGWYFITGSVFSTILFAFMSAGALFKGNWSTLEVRQITGYLFLSLTVSVFMYLIIWRWRNEEKFQLRMKAFAAGMPLAFICWILVDLLVSGSLKQFAGEFFTSKEIGSTLFLMLFSSAILAVPVVLLGFRRIMKCTWALLVFVLIATAALVFHESMGWGKQQRNATTELPVEVVILLTVDTLRADALSAYGSEEVPTKNLDGLLGDSIQYDSAYASSSWTLPSFASMFTGYAPQTHQVLKPISVLDDMFQTLPEFMNQAGYATAAVGYNPFLTYTNFDQGFDWFDVSPNTIWGSTFGGKVLRRIFPDPGTAEITDRAIQLVEKMRGDPFFLWVHYFDPHLPYAPPESYLPEEDSVGRIGSEFDSGKEVQKGELVLTGPEKERVKELYLAEVRFVDDQIGRLLNSLRDLGIYEKSLILFTSDHGEEFWEHGGFEHGHTFYNEVVKVPLGIKLPGQTDSVRVTETVSLQAVVPTMLQLSGIGDPANFPEQWPLPLATNIEEYPMYLAGTLYGDPLEAVYFKKTKFIRNQESHSLELVDLMDLPLTQASATERSALLKEGGELLDFLHLSSPIVRENIGLTGEEEASLDQGTLDSLRALGYMQ